jgi:diacylglycerol kinase
MKNKFGNAWKGILTGIQHRSILIQMILGLCAVAAGLIMKLTAVEWCLVVICIGSVIGTEMLNTCIEKICNMYSMEYRSDIKIIKDIAAGAVLIVSIMSFVTALIILFQHI